MKLFSFLTCFAICCFQNSHACAESPKVVQSAVFSGEFIDAMFRAKTILEANKIDFRNFSRVVILDNGSNYKIVFYVERNIAEERKAWQAGKKLTPHVSMMFNQELNSEPIIIFCDGMCDNFP